MEITYGIFILLLGVIIGSFLNVVILRYNTGKTLGGRSFCFSCGKKLRWYELVPIFSFIFQKGKCRGCKSKISFQYPLVELGTGFLFLITYLSETSLAGMILMFFIWSALVVIFVYDFKHKIIPDGMVFLFIALALLKCSLAFFGIIGSYADLAGYPRYFDFFAGPILFLPFFALWFFSKGKWMGFGDAKLALGIGWAVGLTLGISAVALAFWIGALASVLVITFERLFCKSKTLTIKSEIPFAPFLILGMLIVYIFKWNVVDFQSLFWMMRIS